MIAAPEHGWGDVQVLVPLFAGALLLGAFVLIERRTAAPVLDLRLFSPAFVGALGVLFTTLASFFGFLIYFGIWLQEVRGYSAFAAGAALLPIIAPFLITAPLGRLVARLRAGTVTTWWLLGPALAVLGAGGGLVQAPVMNAALGAVPRERAGLASGIANSARPLGIVVGVAMLTMRSPHAGGDPSPAQR